MISAATKARTTLGDSAKLVADFITSQFNPDGGFKSRDSRSDLYYTSFGIDCLVALDLELPQDKLFSYLRGFYKDKSLDLVHFACLVRSLENIQPGSSQELLDIGPAHRLEQLTCRPQSVYDCFLIIALYQDLGIEIPDRNQMLSFINSMQTDEGGFANDSNITIGSTPVTAAAIVAYHFLNTQISDSAVSWLLDRIDPNGGFLAMPKAPVPDLLSTATALHALSTIGISLESIKEPTLDFIDTLWDSRGGFRGNIYDNTLDCEYTYYGLLAIGHLA
jgi:hypothetical protein